MRVLFIGDVVGRPGRAGLAAVMPELRQHHSPDLVIANGENSAGGLGITEKTANEMFDIGIDVITTGNHVYRHREAYEFLDRSDRVVRPANYPAGNPGRGATTVEAGGMRVAVLNLSGAVQLRVARSPFAEVEAQLAKLEGEADAAIVDFHAEVTSEKVAMGWHLDVTCVVIAGTSGYLPGTDHPSTRSIATRQRTGRIDTVASDRQTVTCPGKPEQRDGRLERRPSLLGRVDRRRACNACAARPT